MRNKTLQVGEIVNTHGLRGEVKIVPWTDYPEVFEDFSHVYLEKGNKKLTIKSVKYQKANLIVKFDEISSIEEAERYKTSVLYVEREQLGEPEEGYYICDLLGISVIDEDGNKLGVIKDVISTGKCNDVYVIEAADGGRDILLPVIDEVILSVDIDEEICRVHIIEGLLDR